MLLWFVCIAGYSFWLGCLIVACWCGLVGQLVFYFNVVDLRGFRSDGMVVCPNCDCLVCCG